MGSIRGAIQCPALPRLLAMTCATPAVISPTFAALNDRGIFGRVLVPLRAMSLRRVMGAGIPATGILGLSHLL
jgi:hypothetical protein